MSRVDQFESVFRSAVKDVYQYQQLDVQKVLVITDKNQQESDSIRTNLSAFLQSLTAQNELSWDLLKGDQFQSSSDLLEQVAQFGPDLICTYRNLHSLAWKYPHSLGTHIDVLLQKTEVPVLLIPHPDANYAAEHSMARIQSVMAITNHLADDPKLVDYAVMFTQATGTVYLSHIEDSVVFERYMQAIGKIETIDTDNARNRLADQLLKEPTDYIQSCRASLEESGLKIRVESIVSFGHSLRDYQQYIEQHDLDLLLMHAKDHDQLAMHGLAYPLAVELREIPLLMI